MMEGPAGRSLLQEMFDEALSFRRALANLRQHIAADDWWFSIWQPPSVEGIDRVATADWLLQPEDDWHGFGDVADDYVLLDPIKVTLVMPGLNAGGALSDGIPAAVVSKFLWERGLVVEKTGLYSFLVLFSMGITKGKWSTCSPSCWSSSAATTPTSAWPVACRRYWPRSAALSGHGPARPVRSIARCYRSNATANTSSGCTRFCRKSR
jgi:arginine decarboxylase